MENIKIFVALAVLAVDFCCVIAAVAADLVAGVTKARREGRRLTSSGFRRTVDKLSRYCLSLFGLMVVDAVVIAAIVCLNLQNHDSTLPVIPFFTSLGALGLTLIEVKSIFESSSSKGDLEEAVSIIGKLLETLRRK